MNFNDIYQKILKCDCDRPFVISESKIACHVCKKEYSVINTYINFFEDEKKRPFWSMHMQNEFQRHGIVLNMADKYDAFEQYYLENEVAQDFFEVIANSGDVIIDLASGPSGYFGKMLKLLNSGQFFIITDGSPMIIEAHMKANQGSNNIGYIDMDLDNKLPLNSGSVDCFTGRFLDNVMEYMQLIAEVNRCLKSGGRFSVMELFFEEGSETALEMRSQGELYASLSEYISYCTSLGFTLEKMGVVETYIGKLDPSDEMPKNDLDKSEVIAMSFVKK